MVNPTPTTSTATAAVVLALTLVVTVSAQGVMGPLYPDTTALDSGSGGCVNQPGNVNSVCADVGTLVNATACALACEARPDCSAMTWHDANQGQWALHCVLRLDGVWAPRGCGAGCGHTAANKTSGWVPFTVGWWWCTALPNAPGPPLTLGCTAALTR
jgi:hypothetical protein